MSSEPGAPAPAGVIPLCVPEIRGKEWDYVKECLDSSFVSSIGPYVNRFEREVTERIGTRYAVATASGTSALHVALLVAGVQPDDEVLVSTLTFIAPVNAIRYVGAVPVFVDAEPEFWQMDILKAAAFLERDCRWSKGELRNKITDRRIKAIMPVHILGHPVDMDPILELARKYELMVIEDASEALGTLYRGKPAGGLGDIACLSFNGNKLITTGGGGMVLTDNDSWAVKAKYLTTQAKDDPVEYIHKEIGYNYRLTNIQAAVGCAQLEQLDEFINAKRHIAAAYSMVLDSTPGITPMREAPWAQSTWWMYTVLVDESCYGIDSRSLLQTMRQNNIETRPLWQPAHMSPAHGLGVRTHCEVAEKLNREGLSLPCSVGLSGQEQERVVDLVQSNARTRS